MQGSSVLQPINFCENLRMQGFLWLDKVDIGSILNKERFCLEKLKCLKCPQIFPARTVNVCDMHKSNRCFWVSLDMLGEINFWSKPLSQSIRFFCLKTCLGKKKRRLKGVGAFRKFGGWGTETFSDQSKSQTPCNMAVIDA